MRAVHKITTLAVCAALFAFPAASMADDDCAEGQHAVHVGDRVVCLTMPIRPNSTPGAFGCPNGGVQDADGTVVCYD
ncbi:MAG: hypothetical protein QM820_39380 [Minicystis sp.]